VMALLVSRARLQMGLLRCYPGNANANAAGQARGSLERQNRALRSQSDLLEETRIPMGRSRAERDLLQRQSSPLSG
jgi:hypothetical protein